MLPPEDKVPAAKALLVLLRNLLISREPLYGMGEWAAGYARPLPCHERQHDRRPDARGHLEAALREAILAVEKTHFRVAPVYLKDVSRIQALLCVYFLVLLVEALLERELRQAMQREGLDSLPLYPEDRPCRRPTARRVIDLFDDIYRHTLHRNEQAPTGFITELSTLQRRVLKLLGIPATEYRA